MLAPLCATSDRPRKAPGEGRTKGTDVLKHCPWRVIRTSRGTTPDRSGAPSQSTQPTETGPDQARLSTRPGGNAQDSRALVAGVLRLLVRADDRAPQRTRHRACRLHSQGPGPRASDLGALHRTSHLRRTGELARAQAALERTQRIAEELGQPTLQWFSTFHAATWELLHGELAAAQRLAERSRRRATASSTFSQEPPSSSR